MAARAGSGTRRRRSAGGARPRSAAPPRRRPTSGREALRELAARLGIVDEYVDQTGRERRRTSDETRILLLRAMGYEAGTEAEARASLERIYAEDRATILQPVLVVREGETAERIVVEIDALGADVSWAISVRDEQGVELTGGGISAAGAFAEATAIAYPPALPAGYYDVRLTITGAEGSWERHQLLVVTPGRCPAPEEALGAEGVFGLIANLYTVRSAANWGVGNMADLRALLEWGGAVGAAFVGVSPLHALFNRGTDISPYSPVSRLFRNPIYIDVTALPELAGSAEARALLESAEVRRAIADLQAADLIDYERAAATLDPVLRAVFRSFVERDRPAGSGRWPEFERFVAAQGQPLDDFATFMALDRHFNGAPGEAGGDPAPTSRSTRSSDGLRRAPAGRPWQEWPADYRDPRSEAVRRFRERHADELMYHRWLQFALDSQLGDAAAAASEARMPIGLYQDLAIGSSPHGSDTWAYPELFVTGASVGAPPDPYSETGQNWGLPPLHPRRLALDRYRYWIDLVRGALRHAGALRIDHVMGLFQQFWIPAGEGGEKGAYVRFPAEDLLGILALEARRANALVVGEDLGTVPLQVPPAMREWEMLSSKVLYFERTRTGGFRPAAKYPWLALATVNTHDMPPLAGWWEGVDIDLRNAAGLLGRPGREDATVRRARAAREREKRTLLRRLAAEGALPSARTPASDAILRGGVHRFLCMTPSALVGVSLDDLTGEREPVNLPGVPPDVYPSWRRRMRTALESLPADEGVNHALGCETRRP